MYWLNAVTTGTTGTIESLDTAFNQYIR